MSKNTPMFASLVRDVACEIVINNIIFIPLKYVASVKSMVFSFVSIIFQSNYFQRYFQQQIYDVIYESEVDNSRGR